MWCDAVPYIYSVVLGTWLICRILNCYQIASKFIYVSKFYQNKFLMLPIIQNRFSTHSPIDQFSYSTAHSGISCVDGEQQHKRKARYLIIMSISYKRREIDENFGWMHGWLFLLLRHEKRTLRYPRRHVFIIKFPFRPKIDVYDSFLMMSSTFLWRENEKNIISLSFASTTYALCSKSR